MATTPVPASPEHPRGSTGKAGKFVEYEHFIEEQLRKTRGYVRSVDLSCALLTMVAWILGYFLLMALVEHWIVPGGFGFWGRLFCFLVLLAGVIYQAATQVLPLIVRRINPVYAAQTIERSKPSLKNSLINFLLLRSSPEGLPQGIYNALEEQAARNLAKVPVEVAVDRSKLILIGYVLLAVLLVNAAYKLFSPKDPLRTAARIILPWAELEAPTRATIRDVQPGDAQVFRGQRIKVSAEIHGVGVNDPVKLLSSTADGQISEQVTAMVVAPDDYRYSCVLTTGDEGVQQSVAYRIEAGDCVTRTYHINVVAAPTIIVQSVDYDYPAYTGLVPQHVESQGDLKAIEGTQVTVHALANQPVRTASIDLNCDGAHLQPMQTAADRASGTITLALKPDRKSPDFTSYQVRFKNNDGQENPEPVRYQIEVTPDLAPEIQFLAPNKNELELPVNAALTWEVVANDPDFALGRVSVLASRAHVGLFERALLGELRRGQFNAKFRFEPNKLGLKPGDTVEYWAVAEDNKQPEPNRTETAKRRIVIVAPAQGAGRNTADRQSQQEGHPDRRNEGEASQNGEQQGATQNQTRGEDGRSKKSQPSQNGRDNQPAQASQQSADDKTKQQTTNPSEGSQQPDQAGKPGQDSSKKGAAGQSPNNAQNDKAGQSAGRDGANDQTADSAATDNAATDNASTDNANASGQSQGSKDQGGRDQSVANDGSNDGDVFERVLKHREEQSKQQGQQGQGQDQSQDGASAQRDKANQQSGQQPGQQQNAGSQDDSSSTQGQSSNSRGGQPQSNNRQPKQAGSGDQQNSQDGTTAEKAADQNNDRPADREQSGNQQAHGSQRGEQSPGDDKAQSGGNDDAQQRQAGPSAQPSSKSNDGAPQDQQDHDAAGTSDQPHPGPQDAAKPDGKQSPDSSQANQANQHASRDAEARDTQGKGAQAQPSGRDQAGQKPSADPQRPNARGGDSDESKGQSGAGKQSRDDKGSPMSQGQRDNERRNAQPESQGGQHDPEDQPDSPSVDRHESDSKSDSSGDRHGGGGKGGGQKANKAGTGGAGENTASDEGNGASPERGEGQTGHQAGDRQPSDKPTGQAGQEPGAGSTSRSSDRGQTGRKNTPDRPTQQHQQPGGATGSGSEQGQPSQGNPRQSQPLGQGGAGGSGAASSNPLQGNAGPSPPSSEKSPDVAEQANLEYAKKATELALTHLRDQLKSGDPDPALLDQLGWTRDDLEQFLRRWEAMERSAKVSGPKGAAAKRELSEALRSLGLRPRGSSLKSNANRDDELRGLKESQRTSPPPEYADQYKAYTRGTSRGEK